MPGLSKNTFNAERVKIGIVCADFNSFITDRLLKACLDELDQKGVSKKNLTIVRVPGAFDIPLVALTLARKNNIDAVICLGAVIRGETFHFELVANQSAAGILQVSLLTGKPVIFGVLSTNTVKQAQNRSQVKGDNKGLDAAQSCLQMLQELKKFKL